MSNATSAVTSVAHQIASSAAGHVPSATMDPKLQGNLHKVAKEFETLMVHQLLEAAKVGGDGQDGGYKGMAVDAFASGVSQAGGLGLAAQIENALSRGR